MDQKSNLLDNLFVEKMTKKIINLIDFSQLDNPDKISQETINAAKYLLENHAGQLSQEAIEKLTAFSKDLSSYQTTQETKAGTGC